MSSWFVNGELQSSRKLFKLAGQQDQWIVWIYWPPMIFTGPLKYIIKSLIKTKHQSDFTGPTSDSLASVFRPVGFREDWNLWWMNGECMTNEWKNGRVECFETALNQRYCLVKFCLPRSIGVSLGVLNVNNVEGSWMSLSVLNHTHSPQVVASSDHTQVSCITLKQSIYITD
jgi:hypothetical protein